MQPTRVLPAVSVLSLVSVEYGGWALLGFLTGRGQLGQFRQQFFRAGHAHAGVLLVLSLVYVTRLGPPRQKRIKLRGLLRTRISISPFGYEEAHDTSGFFGHCGYPLADQPL